MRGGRLVTIGLLAVLAGLPQGSSAAKPSGRAVKVLAHFEYPDGIDIGFHGDRAFFTQAGAASGRVRVMDIARAKPRIVGDFRCGGEQNDVVAIGKGIIAVGNQWGTCGPHPASGVNLIDVSDPDEPRHLGFAPIPLGVHTLTKHPTKPLIYTSTAVFALGTGVSDPIGDEVPTHIIDVSDPMTPVTRPTTLQGCHDISFHISKRSQLAFCAAGFLKTEMWDVSDPLQPEVVGEIRDEGIEYHHLAVATPDGRYLVIGDESSQGSCSGKTAEREFGAISIYDIRNIQEPKMVGFVNGPRGPSVCWAHNFNFIPATRQVVIAWWQAGTSVIDLTDPRRPKEIAHFAPDTARAWASYWYKGSIYVNSGTGAWVIRVDGLGAR